MPWIALDFVADVEHATSELPPRILSTVGGASAVMRGGGETGQILKLAP